MALGTYTGLNYEMPQEQVTPAGYGQPQSPEVGNVPEGPQIHPFLENPQEGLQYTDKLTREYYDKYMGIRSFVDNAWRNYGIDVTKPDMSKEGAMDLHRLYQKAVADVMYTGDILKNSQTQLGKMNQGQIDGKIRMNQGVRTSSAPVSTRDPREMYTSTADSNILAGAKQRAAQPARNTAEFQRRMDAWEQGINDIEQRIEQEPDNAQYWESQLEAMMQAKPGREFNSAELAWQRPQKGDDDSSATPFVSMVERLKDVKNFSADGIEPIGVDPETGNAMLGINAFSGNKLGTYSDRGGVTRDRTVDYLVPNPDGTLKVTFKDSGVEPETYDNLVDFMRVYVNSNQGTTGYQKMMSELKSQGYVKEDGTLNEEKFLSKQEGVGSKDLVRQGNLETQKKSNEIAKQVTKEYESQVDDYWKDNKNAFNFFGVEPLVFQLPSGKTVKFKVIGRGNDAKFTLVNKNDFTKKDQEKLSSLTPELLKKFLHSTDIITNAFLEELQKPAQEDVEEQAGTGVVQVNDSITDVSGLFN